MDNKYLVTAECAFLSEMRNNLKELFEEALLSRKIFELNFSEIVVQELSTLGNYLENLLPEAEGERYLMIQSFSDFAYRYARALHDEPGCFPQFNVLGLLIDAFDEIYETASLYKLVYLFLLNSIKK